MICVSARPLATDVCVHSLDWPLCCDWWVTLAWGRRPASPSPCRVPPALGDTCRRGRRSLARFGLLIGKAFLNFFHPTTALIPHLRAGIPLWMGICERTP